jgi:hypothetical protein
MQNLENNSLSRERNLIPVSGGIAPIEEASDVRENTKPADEFYTPLVFCLDTLCFGPSAPAISK